MAFTRPHLSLDGRWRFIADPDRELDVAGLFEGIPIEVPSCWESLLGPTTPLTTAWYVRSFELPADWDAAGTMLRFGAVSDRAEVWLNGIPLGGHEGGYTSFELAAGVAAGTGTNELVVRVVNPAGVIERFPSSDDVSLAELDASPDGAGIREMPLGKQTWYSSLSGIWQSVTVEGRAPIALARVDVTPDVGAGQVSVVWTLGSGRRTPDGLELRLRVFDADGVTVGKRSVAEPAPRGSVALDLSAPRLWELDDPYLYRLDAELWLAGDPIDGIEVRFGMREIGVAEGSVTLNGRPRYLRGVLDQDVYEPGIWLPSSRSAVEATLRKAKAMGFNLVRCHIKVPVPAYLDIADEIGILVWAELPSWNRLTDVSSERARQTLGEIVAQLGNHPSIAIWTIVNEDWGTDLVHSAGDRAWLRSMVEWLKALDQTRLVVDNSACWTHEGGNFHLRTDLADYHLYYAMPEHAERWQAATAAFAVRPGWLWGPDGESSPSDEAPLILSEFGNWGLPRVWLESSWWTETGAGPARAEGAHERFDAQGLGRIAPDPEALAEATQWHQFEAMQFEVGDLRGHPPISGYVVTELTDVFWEANGVIDLHRSAKAYDTRLPDVFGATTVFAALERWDLWGGDPLRVEVQARFDDTSPSPEASATWRVMGRGLATAEGAIELDVEPGGRHAMGWLELVVPTPDAPTEAELTIELLDAGGARVARQAHRLIVAPRSAASTTRPRTITIAGGPTGERVAAMGHLVAADGELLITDRLNDDAVALRRRRRTRARAARRRRRGRLAVGHDAVLAGRSRLERPAGPLDLDPIAIRCDRPGDGRPPRRQRRLDQLVRVDRSPGLPGLASAVAPRLPVPRRDSGPDAARRRRRGVRLRGRRRLVRRLVRRARGLRLAVRPGRRLDHRDDAPARRGGAGRVATARGAHPARRRGCSGPICRARRRPRHGRLKSVAARSDRAARELDLAGGTVVDRHRRHLKDLVAVARDLERLPPAGALADPERERQRRRDR